MPKDIAMTQPLLDDLLSLTAGAVPPAEEVLETAKARVRAAVTDGDRISGAKLEEHQGAAHALSWLATSGYGFTAIIVAFLGRLHPIGILLAGLLMALTYIGGELAQLMLGMPAAAIQLFQGMLLFFLLAMDVFANYRIRLRDREVAQ